MRWQFSVRSKRLQVEMLVESFGRTVGRTRGSTKGYVRCTGIIPNLRCRFIWKTNGSIPGANFWKN